MASVRKRILPSREVRWELDYKDLTGKRRGKLFKTKSEAIAYETRIRTEIAAGTHVADSAAVTVREAGDLWLRRAETEGLEPSTARQFLSVTQTAAFDLLRWFWSALCGHNEVCTSFWR